MPPKYLLDQLLGDWVQELRQSKSTLTAEQVESLNALEFDWEVEEEHYKSSKVQTVSKKAQAALDKRWNEGYAKLKGHFDKHGSLQNVGKDKFLKGWVSHQTYKFRKGDMPVGSERYTKLQRLGIFKDDAAEPDSKAGSSGIAASSSSNQQEDPSREPFNAEAADADSNAQADAAAQAPEAGRGFCCIS